MTGWERYCQGVTDGNIVVCDLVRRAVLRFLDMLEDERLEFKTKKVERVIAFFSILRHFKGKHSGKPFLLEDWQMFIIAAIYGFYYTGTNERVVTSVYIEMARKQGKTAFAAGLCLYHVKLVLKFIWPQIVGNRQKLHLSFVLNLQKKWIRKGKYFKYTVII